MPCPMCGGEGKKLYRLPVVKQLGSMDVAEHTGASAATGAATGMPPWRFWQREYPKLNGIAACLLDCSDAVRAARYQARAVDPRWTREPQLHWAAWHRRHARDPQWMPHVVNRNGHPTHRYDRRRD